MKGDFAHGLELLSFALDRGLITAESFKDVEKNLKNRSDNPYKYAVDAGILDDGKIKAAVASYLDLSQIEGDSLLDISNECTGLIPKKYVVENRVVPISLDKDQLLVAISEPSCLRALNGAKLIANKKLVAGVISHLEMESLLAYIKGEAEKPANLKTTMPDPIVASPSVKEHEVKAVTPSIDDLSKTTSKLEVENASQLKDDLKEDAALAAQVEAISKASNKKATRFAEGKETDGRKVIDFVDDIIFSAVEAGASDIHIEPYDKYSQVRFRIDGVLQDQEKYKGYITSNYPAVSTRLKILSSLDIAERRLPQDGAIVSALPDGRSIDLRVSVLPTVFGERIVMRILDRGGISFDLDKLGIPERELKQLESAVDASQGLVLVTGPTGSGKSTTLYGVLRRLNKPDVNILTAEDPVEFTVEGIGQVQVKDDIGLTFSSALRSFLRQDPEVILVGEIRDRDTADIAIKASLTGHLVLSTLHANDSIGTVVRLQNMGVPGYLVGSSLTLVVAQRLARKICPRCKAKDETNKVPRLMSVGFSEEQAESITLYKGVGCTHCSHTGYKGRQGIYEILKVDQDLRAAIVNDASETVLKDLALKSGFKTMQEIGRDMICDGRLTIAEYQRNLVAG